MTGYRSRWEPLRRAAARTAAARLRRLAVALAAAACGLLASALILPAASARTMLIPGPGGADGPTPGQVPPSVSAVSGGMAGWQIALIAVGAALVGAAAAVVLDRARAARRSASATSV
jgi:hypothetical protein